jgi:hypothetical protein
MKSQRIARLAILCIAIVCLMPLLFACGREPVSSSEPEVSSEATPATPDTIWQPREKNGYSGEFQRFAEEAREMVYKDLALTADATTMARIDEQTTSGFYAELFYTGNESYRNGDYFGAMNYYDTLLGDLPTHLGANNNLTLALLQQGENDAALVQALKTMIHYPEETGCLLNVQVAADACGFDSFFTEEQLEVLLLECGSPLAYKTPAGFESEYGSVGSAYAYNFAYSLIDFYMDQDDDIADWYRDFRARITGLSLYKEGDPDAEALLEYLDGIARLNDLRIPSFGL